MLQLSHWERFAGGTARTDCCNPHICINQLYQSALVITRIMFSAGHGAQMKTFFVAAAILIPTASYAADMAVKAPPPSAVYNWTGFYIGGFVGGAGADRNASASEPLSAAGPYNGPNRLDTQVTALAAASLEAALSATTGRSMAVISCSVSKAKPATFT